MNRFFVAGYTAAFSLVEVVLALGVTSFCLIALVGLLSVGLRSNQNTVEQAGASAVLSAAVSDLYATPPTLPSGLATNSIQFNIAIPAATTTTPVTTIYFVDSGLATNAVAAQSVYRLTVTPLVPTGAGSKTATFFDLKVTWPATVSVANAAGTVETFVSLNRN